METKLEMNTLIVEDKNVTEPPKKIKKSKPKKNIDFVIEDDDELTEITIKYNNITYCIDNPNKDIIIKKETINNNIKYLCYSSNKDKYCVLFTYKNIEITLNIKSSVEILLLYIILQYHYSVINIQELINIQVWDYDLWNVNITPLNDEELPDHLILLNCFLNLKDKYNKPIEITELEDNYKLKIKDKRGLGGERPRELNYKYGFPYFTSSTKKYLNNSQRVFICPFPIENINPQRKAIVSNSCVTEPKCFTCGTKEGEINIFGQICNFEKGHLTPIKCENTTNSYWQCKWCNTFYKDKIIWNEITNKPEFNCYAIIRDMKKSEIINIIKQLGIKPSDLN